MIEKNAIFRFEKSEGFCSVEAIPDLKIVEIFGNCDLTLAEIENIRDAFNDSPSEFRLFGRFVFLFPNVDSDLAFQIADVLESQIVKAAFVVHISVHHKFKEKMFWVLCKHSQIEMAYLEALRLVAEIEVDSMNEDQPADYGHVMVDPSVLKIQPDEAF